MKKLSGHFNVSDDLSLSKESDKGAVFLRTRILPSVRTWQCTWGVVSEGLNVDPGHGHRVIPEELTSILRLWKILHPDIVSGSVVPPQSLVGVEQGKYHPLRAIFFRGRDK